MDRDKDVSEGDGRGRLGLRLWVGRAVWAIWGARRRVSELEIDGPLGCLLAYDAEACEWGVRCRLSHLVKGEYGGLAWTKKA